MLDLSLLFLAVVWGINNPVIKHALQHFSPLSFNSLCFILASLMVFALFKKQSGKLPNFGKDWPKIIVVGILGNTIYQILFIFGINRTLAGNTSLILAAVPAFVAIISLFTKSEKLSRLMWTGIGISFLGVGCVMFGGNLSVGMNKTTLPGDLLVLAGAIVTSLYVVGIYSLVKRYDVLATVAITLISGALVMFLASIPSLIHQNWNVITVPDWLSLIYSASLAVALAEILMFRAIKENGGVRMAIYNNVVPLVSLLAAWAMLGEIPKFTQIFGGSTILLGTFLTGLRRAGTSAAEASI